MDLKKARQDFPTLQADARQKQIIYFDNACQTLRPRVVIDAIQQYYLSEPACAGRSMHHMAAEVTRGVDQARTAVAKFLGAARKEEIVFTRNTTEGINLVAHALGLHSGDVVLVSDKEHNSNLIPWQTVARKSGATLRVVPSRADNSFDLEAFEQALEPGVRLVSLGYTSNLDGLTIPAAEVIHRAHRAGALVLLDAAQAAPHRKISVSGLDVDFLALSGHKLLGPSGTGVLYGKYKLLESLDTFMVGGETVATSTYETCQFLPPPEKFEAGLQDYAGIMGLGAAVKYLQGIGFDAIQKQEQLLNECITTGIQDLPGLHLIGPADPHLRGGVVSFYMDGIDAHRIALMLDQMAGIAVRSGQHCVHSWFNAHQLQGAVRASLYFYNTQAEAETFIDNLRKIRKVL
ncbi:MAG: cysteine desulfurase [Chloroflexi bacterium]|nr:cysteine desulfurase [Chloroflexota bacterium]